MTTLAANKPRSYELGNRNDLLMIAADIIYEGAAVGIVVGTGHARPLVAGDKFVGFAEATCDNSAGAAAAKSVRVVECGKIQLAVSGATITDIGKPVYASDDDTFTLTASTNTYVGRVYRHVSSGVVVVDFDANPAGGTLTPLTDSSGGVASDTLAVITGSYVQATQAAAIASLAAKINAIIAYLK